MITVMRGKTINLIQKIARERERERERERVCVCVYAVNVREK